MKSQAITEITRATMRQPAEKYLIVITTSYPIEIGNYHLLKKYCDDVPLFYHLSILDNHLSAPD
jgi:hypothetical protein